MNIKLQLGRLVNASHRRFLDQRQFGSLDGLRAVSIVAVIWHHTAPTDTAGVLSHLGGHGVTLFFAISGFLITTLLMREWRHNGVIDLKSFYVRRTLRIFPLYYLVLFIYIILVYFLERNTAAGQAFFSNLIYYLTYTSNIFVVLDGRTIFYFAWSLAAEEQFYLIWPALLLYLRNGFRAALVLGLLTVGVVVAQFFWGGMWEKVPVAIIVGSLIALLLDDKKYFGWLSAFFGRSWSIPVSIVFIWMASSVNGLPPSILHIGLALLVCSCVIREAHMLAPVLQNRWIRYVGEVSYGMYLLHMLCKNAAAKLLLLMGAPVDSVWLFLVSTALTVVMARLSFRYFESYFLALKERFSIAR